MGELLSQNEIDDLLGSPMSAEELAEETGEETHEKPRTKLKTFNFKQNKNVRFAFPYHSPVIKKENMVFNPETESGNIANKVVVRTLDNYVEFLKNKK